MARLPVRTRRLRARGISDRVIGPWRNRKFLGLGNRATLTTSLAGANNDIQLISKQLGTPGNSTTLTIAVAGNNTPLSVSVAGSAITVNSATNGSAAATSKASDVVKAINAHAQAKLLVWAQTAPGNDGTGTVVALASTALSGATAKPNP